MVSVNATIGTDDLCPILFQFGVISRPARALTCMTQIQRAREIDSAMIKVDKNKSDAALLSVPSTHAARNELKPQSNYVACQLESRYWYTAQHGSDGKDQILLWMGRRRGSDPYVERKEYLPLERCETLHTISSTPHRTRK